MSFEWQTAEDGDWDAERQPPETPGPRPGLRRRLPAIVALLLLAGLASVFLYRQIQKQLSTAQVRVGEEVLASHELFLNAASEEDEELLVNMLSGRDEVWTDAQRALLARDALFDRPWLEMRLLPAGRDPEAEVTLTPALEEAKITFRQTYILTAAAGVTETVQLAHQAVYRKGARQWLYAPPADADAFWGRSDTFAGERLTVAYPARDAALAERLAADLDAKLVALCGQPGLSCAGGWHVYLELGSDPELLLRLTESGLAEAMRGHLEFSLPAPTLVGIPVDETGYQAVFQGYADYVLTSAMAELLGYDCCRHALFFRALAEQQLAELDARSLPLSPVAFQAVVDDFQPLAVEALWNRASLGETTASEWRLVRAFVAFLVAEGGQPVAAWQQRLVQSDRFVSLGNWLEHSFSEVDVEQAWQAFILARLAEAQATPRLPLPEQDLLLACNTGDTNDLILVRYRPENGTWTREQMLAGERAALLALPGGKGVLAFRYGVQRGVPRSLVWHPSGVLLLTSERSRDRSSLVPVSYTAASTSLDPRGRFLVLLRWNREERVQDGYRLFDLACRECGDRPFPGIPVWSPDGAQVLAGNERWLWRFERHALDEQVASIQGRVPFWLDATTYGYLAGDLIMLANVEDDQADPFLRLEQLAPLLPEALREETLEIWQVLVPRNRTNSLLLVARQPDNQVTLVFQVERGPAAPSFLDKSAAAGEISLLWQQEAEHSPLAYLLDGGRLLAISSMGNLGPRLRVYDVPGQRKVFETVQGETMGSVDFAADERWLALAVGQFVELVAIPEDGHRIERHFLFPPFANCESATWVQQSAVRTDAAQSSAGYN